MNIGFVSDSFPMGGLARAVTEIGNAIEEENYCSFYLSAIGDSSNYYDIPKSKLTIPKLKIKETELEKNIDKLRKFIEMKLNDNKVDLSRYLIKQCDNITEFIRERDLDCLIICRYDLSFLVKKIKLEFPNLKVLVWIHGPVEIYTQKKERKKYLSYYIQNLSKCDYVICLTEFDITELKKFGISGTKIYNSVPFKRIDSPYSSTKDNSILCVSRLDIRDKGIDSLVKLADALPIGWKVKLVGSGDKNEMEQFNTLLSKMRNRNKLIFLGSKNSLELEEIYLKSNFFISPSLYEGFGLTLIEAMNFGLPVVSFMTSGAKEITNDGEFGILVKDFSVDAMINECLDLIKDSKRIKKYSNLSYSRSEIFNLENVRKQWVELLER
ncbi:glycosyltransferase [Enterococcus pseudoavium]|uniref:Glycosyltransferase n=1 Tax=Enterococcus pseudoavium TaxID=44007 RepID=A0AAE4I320_9ENTE|nr:glycosyltransferase [Enterococcus pseudoavium]MDT2737232.1 glycosyltransferase [Enterococcus pseudoavium]